MKKKTIQLTMSFSHDEKFKQWNLLTMGSVNILRKHKHCLVSKQDVYKQRQEVQEALNSQWPELHCNREELQA